MAHRILVCDPIAEDGIEAMKSAGAEVDVRLRLPPAELKKAVDDYDAIIVRSETKVTAEVIQAAKKLQVIGRAGIGVENIDLDAATERGVVVVNAPSGNVVSAAEHAIGLMLALARNIPQADASLKQGKWDRRRFMGSELRGKTLGVIGLGQVGSEVARRGRSLEMRVIAYDPFVIEERARVLAVDLLSLEELLQESDFISIHASLTEETTNLIGEKELALMKPTARIINTARGGIVDEGALAKALEECRIAGAALDVFNEEPLTSHQLFASDKVIVTPHLGASTAEAQERVALDVAEQIMAVLNGEPARYAVNAPLIPPETYSVLAPYLPVAQKVGSLVVQLYDGQLGEIEIEYAGEIASHDVVPLKAAVVRGLLASISEEHVNVVNVDMVAQRRGLRIIEKLGPSHSVYANLVSARLRTTTGETSVCATLAQDGPHIVLINDFWVDVPPSEGYLLVCENKDRPGMIGAVGALLGELDINISFMNVGRHERRGSALMVLTLDEPLSAEQIKQVRQIPGILMARVVRL